MIETMKAMLAFAVALGLATPASADPQAASAAKGPIPVAVVITDGATVIDFAGPWEVFQDTSADGSHEPAFRLFTVGESREPVTASAGLKIVPDYTFEDAPAPRIVVVGAQRGSPHLVPWLKKVAADPGTELVMSVCTGAFKLGDAGLLDGKEATTHHDFFDAFAKRFPHVKLNRSARYVESDARTFTAGGLTSGVDLALHVVVRYFGQAAAQRAAVYMEYQGTGWKTGTR